MFTALGATVALAAPSSANASATWSPADRPDDTPKQLGIDVGTIHQDPIASDTNVSIDSDAPSARLRGEGGSVGVSLLGVSDTQSELSSAAHVYRDATRDTDAVVRAVDGGVQFLSVMRTPSAPATQRYQLELPNGTTLTPAGEGFELVGSDGEVYGSVHDPWATDATGRRLSTSYELDGTVLVQRTDTTGAKYPVVVDPRVTIGLGIYLNMWGHELRTAAIAIIAIGGTGVAVGCATIGKLPFQILRTLATMVCAVAAVNLKTVFRAIADAYRSTAIVNNWCYQKKVVPDSGYYKRVSASNC